MHMLNYCMLKLNQLMVQQEKLPLQHCNCGVAEDAVYASNYWAGGHFEEESWDQ